MACAIFKSPSLDVALQPRDVCVRRCTALKSICSKLDFFSLSPMHLTVGQDFANKIAKILKK